MVDLDKAINMSDIQTNCRVALRNDSYKLHKILPNKVGGAVRGRVAVVFHRQEKLFSSDDVQDFI